MISCIDQGIKCTRRNGTVKYDRRHLVDACSEINLLENSMQNCICLHYKTLIISCHCQTQGENAGSRSTVNLSFRRLIPKIQKNYKIQQTTKNVGKWEEARY